MRYTGRVTGLALLLLLSSPAPAQESCASRIAKHVAALRPSFPALQPYVLTLEAYDGKDDFFRARPDKAWRAAADRVYVLMVNNEICADPPPPEAERAIIAHELAHFETYAGMSSWSFIGFGWRYWRSPEGDYVASFERDADRRAVKAGHAAGLAEYRRWLYAKIGPEREAVKRRLYMTPEELLSSSR